jgi:hypothetical protein
MHGRLHLEVHSIEAYITRHCSLASSLFRASSLYWVLVDKDLVYTSLSVMFSQLRIDNIALYYSYWCHSRAYSKAPRINQIKYVSILKTVV